MKNKFMRIAAVALMLCLVTTCAISGTFAKYTTEGTATDSARVAKWGITVSAPTDKAFAVQYEDVTGDNGVQVKAAEQVVAPGTEGTLPTPIISGTAEVAVEVIVEATITLTGWEVNSDEYCPIVFTVGTETYGTDDTNATNKSATVAALITAVEKAIEDYTANYGANETIATIPAATWAWEFEVNDANNELDTELGRAASAKIGYEIVVTVNQLN